MSSSEPRVPADAPAAAASAEAPADAEPPAKRKKSSAVRNKVGTVAADKPKLRYCSVVAHPLQVEHLDALNSDVMRAIEIIIPANMYPTAPQTLLGFVGHPGQVTQYKQLLMIFGYLATQVHAPRKRKDEDGNVETVRSQNYCSVTFERVPHKDDPRRFVAYRLRLTEHGPQANSGMTGDLADLLTHTDVELAKRLRLAGPTSRPLNRLSPYSYASVTTSIWQRLCEFYRPLDMKGLQQRYPDSDVRSPRCAYNIQHVFTRQYSLEIAERLGADPAYCDRDIYRYGFADAHNVWLISHTDLDPTEMELRCVPMVRADMRLHLVALEDWRRLHGPHADHLFDAYCNLTSESDVANDITSLTERVRQESAELRARFGHSNEFFVAQRLKQTEWLANFDEIFTPSGDASDSIKAIATWMDNYLVENDHSMRMPHECKTQNLCMFEDFVAQITAVLDTVVTVKSEHKGCFLYLMSALGVYLRVNMNLHTLLLGPAAVGKSFALLLLKRMLIDGTVRVLTYLTPKAFAAQGKANDALILVLEDAPASAFGATGGKNSKTSVSDDSENMIKQLMTSTFLELQTMAIVDGVRKSENLRAECSIVFFGAMNDPTSAFKDAVLSRFNVVINAEDNERDIEGPTMQTKTTRANDSMVKEAFADVGLFWKRTQALMAKAMYLVAAGILPKVNLEAADLVFSMVGAHAKRRYNLKMDETRHWERARQLTTVLVILKAILLVWDSPQCPFIGQPHRSAHFLYLAKHLVATRQIAFFVMGLLSNQWQNQLRSQVVCKLAALCFPDARAKIAALERPVEVREAAVEAPPVPDGVYIPVQFTGRPLTAAQQKQLEKPEARAYLQEKQYYDGMVEVNKYWMYDSCVFGGPTMPTPKSNAGRIPTNEELYLHIANQLMPHLHPRPLLTEVIAILRNLTEHNEETSRLEYSPEHGPHVTVTATVMRPALTVDSERIRLNLTTLRHASESDPLYLACTDVASALYSAQWRPGMADQAQYLYGETEPYPVRYVWRMITARKIDTSQSSDAIRRVWNPHFFDNGLLELTKSFLKGVSGDEGIENRMLKLFQTDAPYTEIDVDLDSYAALQHASDLGLCHDEQHAHPSNDERIQRRAIYEIFAARHRLLVYPQCFVQRDQALFKQQTAQKRLAKPASFLMSTRMDEMLRLQSQRVPLPPIVPPEAVPSTPRRDHHESDVDMEDEEAYRQMALGDDDHDDLF